MSDFYPLSKQLADHVNQVTGYLSLHIGIEPAVMRVMERLQIVLQDALEGGNAEDMAFVLRPGGGSPS